MRYYVIADDGNKYGPAEIETLNQWATEGRLLPTTLLEEEGSGARLAARAVAGINFPAPSQPPGPAAPGAPGPGGAGPAAPGANPYAGAPAGSPYGGAPYQRPAQPYAPSTQGNGEIVASWILGVIGILGCCCFGFVLNIIGALLGNSAVKKGNDGGRAPMIVNIVGIVLGVIGVIYWAANWGRFMESYNRALQQNQRYQRPYQPGPGFPSNTSGV